MSERGLRIIDLSVPLLNHSLYDPHPPSIVYNPHDDFARQRMRSDGIRPADWPDGVAMANEVVTANSHNSTHLDAPYHYGPLTNGQPAKTVDEVPLEWCYGNGVRLDFRHKQAGEAITPADVQAALAQIGHEIRPWDVVLIWTGVQQTALGRLPEFWQHHPGMSPEATEWLIDRGVKLMGTDAWGFDRPYRFMFEDYHAGRPNALWPSHMLGRRKEYLHIEKLGHLEDLPGPTGFKVAAFPIKIQRGSGGWVRAVAIIEG